MDPHRTLCSCRRAAEAAKKSAQSLPETVSFLDNFISSLRDKETRLWWAPGAITGEDAVRIITDLEKSFDSSKSAHHYKESVLRGMVTSAQRIIARCVSKFHVGRVHISRDYIGIEIWKHDLSPRDIEVRVVLGNFPDSEERPFETSLIVKRDAPQAQITCRGTRPLEREINTAFEELEEMYSRCLS